MRAISYTSARGNLPPLDRGRFRGATAGGLLFVVLLLSYCLLFYQLLEP